MSSIAPPDYQIQQELFASARSRIYRAERTTDLQSVVIKLLQNAEPSPMEQAQFQNQYAIARQLECCDKILGAYALETWEEGLALILEDGGMALQNYAAEFGDAWFGTSHKSLVVGLQVAIQGTIALEQLYHHHIIHKDIKPANILINPETQQIKLSDFSIASLLPRENQALKSPNVLEGTLAYLSPEQTGRMNRGLDYRTDFYSFGISLYELFCGELPFQMSDPLELVHCHIAQVPQCLGDRNPRVPAMLSLIVDKLIAKNAEDRYQSAFGLRHDLEICLQQLNEGRNVVPFPLAQRDLSDRFVISEQLYGRRTEVDTLLASFDRVSQGNAELTLIAGFSGIGKTAIVNEVHKPIARQRGYFIQGKFDQLQRNVPLAAFVQAFRSLMGQLLTESNAQVDRWQEKILEALEPNAQVIIDVVPELEHLLGKQPEVIELSGSAAQNRFNLLFQKFIQVFTTPEHPLVIFLDDLQWADATSLKMLQRLMGDPDSDYLMLIGAYRDNEVSIAHPFAITVENIRQSGAIVNAIHLASLSPSHINQLVADTLGQTAQDTAALSQLIYEKTQGNPFFSSQYFRMLHDEGHIRFNHSRGRWEPDCEEIQESGFSSNVLEFMMQQLAKLPEETQRVLQLAACIGNQFDLGTLAIVYDHSPTQTAQALWLALEEELVLPDDNHYKSFQGGVIAHHPGDDTVMPSYKFPHDRVQQAASALIPEDQKQLTHLQIGRLLLQDTAEAQLEERLFDIVNQFNAGLDLIGTELNLGHCDRESSKTQESTAIAQLNLLAARKAKESTAYEVALSYLASAHQLLSDNSWHDQYDLALPIALEQIECAFLVGAFDNAEAWIIQVEPQIRTKEARAELSILRLIHYQNNARYDRAIQVGLDCLQNFGVNLPVNPDMPAIMEAAGLVQRALGDRMPSDLLQSEEMTDREQLLLINTLINLVPPTYILNQPLLGLGVLTMTRAAMLHGNSALAVFVYMWYGILLCGNFNEYEQGYEFGRLALELYEKFNSPQLKGRLYMSFGNFVSHWRRPIQDNLEIQQIAYQAAMEAGDFSWCHHSALFSFWQRFMICEEIDSLQLEFDRFIHFADKSEYTAAYAQRLQQSILLSLQGKTSDRTSLNHPGFDGSRGLELFTSNFYEYGLNSYYIAKLFLHYTYGDYQGAIALVPEIEATLHSANAQFQVTVFCFYHALTLLGLYPDASAAERPVYLEAINNCRQKLGLWTKNCPENFALFSRLVEAEFAAISGETWQAGLYYDEAIQATHCTYGLAIAHELAGQFYHRLGRQHLAQSYLYKAHKQYHLWGATTKTQDLEQRYSLSFTPTAPRSIHQLTQETIAPIGTADFDLRTALNASQAIAEEIQLDKLLDRLLIVVMKNAGADHGHILLPEGENWITAAQGNAKGNAKGNAQENTQGSDLSVKGDFPRSLIQYVARTRETLVIADVKTDATFRSDIYIARHQPKSILCLPIVNQSQLVSILYLENNLATGAFTSDRLKVLNLIVTQAAISLQNAKLYDTLEQKVEQRTLEIQAANQNLRQTLSELKQTQTQLIQTEKMSSLGQMVAGFAHEINNPVNFIHGNLKHAHAYCQDLLEVLKLYKIDYPQPSEVIQDYIDEVDLDYMVEDLPKVFASMSMGTERIRQLVLSLRNFSRLDESLTKAVNIHEGIDSTLLLLTHRLKVGVNIIKQYGELPSFECYAAPLNQVFLNLLSNALDALQAYGKSQADAWVPTITITTGLIDGVVVIRIADNGPGIPEITRSKIFDPFFTTKPVGSGTGLGLSISYQIIVDKHRGRLFCESELDAGTAFVVELPVMSANL
jgi:predicted ATPase/signal transduction histidine kinase